jgi:hypothetical protein
MMRLEANNRSKPSAPDQRLIDFFKMLLARYLSLAFEEEIPPQLTKAEYFTPNLRRTIDSFRECQCRINFRFTKSQLKLLLPLLRLPHICTLKNRLKLTGEEVMLRGLYEFSSGDNQEQMSVNVFGGDQPTQSRAFHFFINHMYGTFQHLVHDNLAWWYRNGFCQQSAYAIGVKMGLPNPEENLVSVFIDCNCEPCSVTGGGPSEAGANAARWDDRIQQAFYNGWKSIHGLKHQTINDVFGICVDMRGPASLRRNDMHLLRDSDLVNRFSDLQLNEERQYIIMGDSAYNKQSHLTSYHKRDDQIPGFKTWNLAMKRCRISIEWDYGYTASLFKYVACERKLKLLKGHLVAKVYTVATILRNIVQGFSGGETSNYFDVALPSNYVEHYLTQTDFEV